MFSVGFVADDEPEKPFSYESSGPVKQPKGIIGKALMNMGSSAIAKKQKKMEDQIRANIATKVAQAKLNPSRKSILGVTTPSLMKINRPAPKLKVAPSSSVPLEKMVM